MQYLKNMLRIEYQSLQIIDTCGTTESEINDINFVTMLSYACEKACTSLKLSTIHRGTFIRIKLSWSNWNVFFFFFKCTMQIPWNLRSIEKCALFCTCAHLLTFIICSVSPSTTDLSNSIYITLNTYAS